MYFVQTNNYKGDKMRATQAKRIRREVYGDKGGSSAFRRYSRDQVTGIITADHNRQAYKAQKKAFLART